MRLIGDLKAAGLTKDQFSDQLSSKLSQYIKTKYDLIIKVLSQSGQNITILGGVARQMVYSLTYDISLLQAIAIAGGVSPDADTKHIRIIRGGDPKTSVEVDLNQYLERGRPAEAPMIRAGDVIYVPNDENLVRKMSEFFRDAFFLFSFYFVTQ